MNKYLKPLAIILVFCATSFISNAQYYQIANQLTGLINPALSGSLNYKGYVEASYLKGLGNRQVDFVSVSTSQGFKYKSWFFMGVGIGVDVAMSHTNKNFGENNYGNSPYWDHASEKTGIMVPVFTDFRFNIGNQAHTSFYIDAKIGASFLMGDKDLQVADGFITKREFFYLKPSVGVRLPLKGKTAVDLGVTYQLLTSNYRYNSTSSSNVTLSSLGAIVGFEW